MSETVKMSFDEEKIIRDHRIKNHNFIVVKDPETGKVLQVRKNLVVRKGREFDLRKLFGIPYSGESIATLNTRTLCLFGIGSGGVPTSNPYTPIAPTPADTDLNTAVPFRVATTASPLPSGDVPKYTDGRVVSGETRYFKKTFNTTPTVTINTNTDQVYVKVPLSISNLDARGSLISEIALYSANSPSPNTYNGFIIFSRITFQTEPLEAATGKALDIDYYVYA